MAGESVPSVVFKSIKEMVASGTLFWKGGDFSLLGGEFVFEQGASSVEGPGGLTLFSASTPTDCSLSRPQMAPAPLRTACATPRTTRRRMSWRSMLRGRLHRSRDVSTKNSRFDVTLHDQRSWCVAHFLSQENLPGSRLVHHSYPYAYPTITLMAIIMQTGREGEGRGSVSRGTQAKHERRETRFVRLHLPACLPAC